MTKIVSGVPAPTEVVTCFLRNWGDLLLVRRSAKVGTYRGRWGGVAGHVETDDPLEDAWREIREGTGLQDHVTLVERGEPFTFADEGEGRSWRVHPFLFDATSREVLRDRAAALAAGVDVPGYEAGGAAEPESRANGHEPRVVCVRDSCVRAGMPDSNMLSGASE